MDDNGYTLLIDPDDDSDGSESRFNRIPNAGNEQPVDPEPVFESWYEPQTPVIEQAPKVQPQIEEPVESTQPVRVKKNRQFKQPKKYGRLVWGLTALVMIVFLIPFMIPFKATTLILGIDRPPKGTWIGRSDTMILTSIKPVSSQVSMISIPRDLWVPIPNYGENRINAAHYFGELYNPGTGMQAARDVVESNFGVQVDYVLRIKFDGFIEVVDAFGGVTVDLPEDMSGLTAGKHHLDGKEALKFVRDRKGSDDFFRQQRGQLFLSAAFKEALNPLKWPRFPAVFAALAKNVETDLPIWLWPRMAARFTLSAVNGFDAHTIDRNFITPWVTEDGAQVLLPNWELILPEINRIFN